MLRQRPEAIPSIVELPFYLQTNELQTYLNEIIPRGVIASDARREGNSKQWSYNVQRNEDLKVAVSGDELLFQVPIQINAYGAYTACAGFWRHGRCYGARIRENGETHPVVNLTLKVKMKVKEDYTIAPQAELVAVVSGNTHLNVDLIGNLIRINIDIKNKIERPIQQLVNRYQTEIDNKIKEWAAKYDLKREITNYWDKAFRSVPLDQFWLNIKPVAVIFQNLSSVGDTLKAGFGVHAFTSISTTPESIQVTELPPLTLRDNLNGQYHIYLPGRSTYAELGKIVTRHVSDKKYTYKKYWVKVNNVTLSGIQLDNNVSALLVDASITGKISLFKKVKGHVYFFAVPSIDIEKRILFISDFSITPNTNSVVLNRSLPFLLNNFYYTELKNSLTYDFSKDWEKCREMIDQRIKEIHIDKFTIRGKLDEMKFHGLYIGPDVMEVIMGVTGTLHSDPVILRKEEPSSNN